MGTRLRTVSRSSARTFVHTHAIDFFLMYGKNWYGHGRTGRSGSYSPDIWFVKVVLSVKISKHTSAYNIGVDDRYIMC